MKRIPGLSRSMCAVILALAGGTHGVGHALETFCELEGTWILRLPGGALFVETFIPTSDPRRSEVSINAVIPTDQTLGGMFPEVDVIGGPGARGEIRRTGPRSWDFRIVSYARNLVDGRPAEIAYIRMDEGIARLPECDVQDSVTTASFYLPDSDTDGDGIPEAGAEPFFVAEDVPATGRRLRVSGDPVPAEGDSCELEGTFSLNLAGGAFLTETFVPTSEPGRAEVMIKAVIPTDQTLGGMFPDVDLLGGPGARGEILRTGPRSWDFRIISYTRNLVDGRPAEIAYIRMDEGVATLPECNLQESTTTASFYLPDSDSDGDGIPDEGAEPFFVAEDVPATGSRLELDVEPALDDSEICYLDGTWTLTLAGGGFLVENFAPTSEQGRVEVIINAVIPTDNTLGGMFPDLAPVGGAPARGEVMRTSADAWQFKIVSYACNMADGRVSEIAYIRVDEGVTNLPDCGTQDAKTTASFFAPESDGDGDGEPDEGAEPFLVVEDVPASGFRFDGPSEDGEGAWTMADFDVRGTNHNPHERALGVDNVGDLEVKWVFDSRVAGHPVGPIHATPVIADGRSYVGSFSGMFYAIDRDGQLLWQAPTDEQSGIVGSAVLCPTELLIVYGDMGGTIYARDRDTGELVWSVDVNPHPLGGVIGNSLVPVGDAVIVGLSSFEHLAVDLGIPCCNHRGKVVALDAATGEERWSYETISADEQGDLPPEFEPEVFGPAGADIWGQPTYDAETDTLYIGTGQNFSRAPDGSTSPTTDAIIALDATTGEERWRTQLRAGDIWRNDLPGQDPETGEFVDQDFGDSPTIYQLADGRKVVGAGQKSGAYAVLDALTGEVITYNQLIQQASQLGGFQTGGALVGDTVLQHGLNGLSPDSPIPFEGVVMALSLDGTQVKWRHDLPLGVTVTGLAAANGVVYFQSTRDEPLGREDGRMRWGLYALDIADGSTLTHIQFDGRAMASPAVSGGRLYIGTGHLLFPSLGFTDAGSLVCLGPGDGSSVMFVRGECNDDGSVDLADASCLLGWLLAGGDEPGCMAAGNVNADDKVDIADPISLLNFLFAGGPAPYDPFPDCGPSAWAADQQLGCAADCP